MKEIKDSKQMERGHNMFVSQKIQHRKDISFLQTDLWV